MEKIIYALWREPATERVTFNDRLLTGLPAMLANDVHAIRINIQDEDSLGGTAPAYSKSTPPIEAFVQIWVDSALDFRRTLIDEQVAQFAPHYAAWLVVESAPLPSDHTNFKAGQRTPVYNHIAAISVPPRLTWEAWRDLWQTHHTQVAIDTQANCEYLQNLVVRPLTYMAPPYSAFIEESFPLGAKFDEAVFLDAVGDAGRLAHNRQALQDSTFSFVDNFDLVPTSQFDFRVLGR